MASNLKALSDPKLLVQYTEGGSQEAFAEIVDRYSDLVYAVCQRILGDAQAAEDAAQATFLVLARKAASLTDATALSGWLYLTAQHSARRLLKAILRRKRHEQEAAMMNPRKQAEVDETWSAILPSWTRKWWRCLMYNGRRWCCGI